MIRDQSEHFSPVRTGNKVSFREPRHILRAVVAATDVKPSTLRNWLSREKIEQDAVEGRDAAKWRTFGTYDGVNITVLHSLHNIGLSIADALRGPSINELSCDTSEAVVIASSVQAEIEKKDVRNA